MEALADEYRIGQGWVGDIQNVLHALRTVGADTDAESGEFLLYGAAPAVGLDGTEAVIPPECQYSIDGRRCSLSGLMASTSYGVRVTVI